MKCSHLIARRNRSECSALEAPYTPSLFELSEYCRTGGHRKCPFYMRGMVAAPARSDGLARRVSL